jgi:hypothetical protein
MIKQRYLSQVKFRKLLGKCIHLGFDLLLMITAIILYWINDSDTPGYD